MTIVGSSLQLFYKGNTGHNTRKHMRHPWDMWDHSIVGRTRWKIHEQLGEREIFHVCALKKS